MRSFFLLLFLLTANGLFAENPDITVSDARKILFAKGTDSLKQADALDALHTWAQRGDIEGQYWYAWMRHYGKGDSPIDYQESFRYFTLTAEKDLATEKHKQVVIWAIHWVGLYHGNGWGIPKDPEKCLFISKKQLIQAVQRLCIYLPVIVLQEISFRRTLCWQKNIMSVQQKKAISKESTDWLNVIVSHGV